MNEWMSKTNEELAVDCSRLADQRRRTTGRSPIVERRVDGKTARSADDAERKRLYLSYTNRMGSSCKRISVGEDCLVLGLFLTVCVFSLQSVLFLRFLCCVHSVGCLLRFCCLCKSDWLKRLRNDLRRIKPLSHTLNLCTSFNYFRLLAQNYVGPTDRQTDGRTATIAIPARVAPLREFEEMSTVAVKLSNNL